MRLAFLAWLLMALSSTVGWAAPRGEARQLATWRQALADRLRQQGRSTEASQFAAGQRPDGWSLEHAGDLGLALRASAEGVRLESVFDLALGCELLVTNPPPLFDLTLRHVPTKREVHMPADAAWRRAECRRVRGGLELRWQEAADAGLRGISVTATATADARSHAWRWRLHVQNESAEWSLMRVVFPQAGVADLGERGAVFFPRGPGEVETNIWGRSFKYRGNYTDCWCSMQFMAAYRAGAQPTGLYLATHDPRGSIKYVAVGSDPATRTVRLSYEHPAPNLSVAGNDFELSGEAVWQILRGDWFDAAQIYKAWVRREANWWPQLKGGERSDTPRWMRELNVWALSGVGDAGPDECVAQVKAFREFLGVPTGFHWYNWHAIPFDNDYPHYFPTKPNVAPAVADLKAAGVFVMPYINGRLWDTHDRGAEDFEFSTVALPATTKQEDCKPCLESYGTKETNGTPVRLAVMCPATPVWQQRVGDIVLRLLGEVGMSAVYIDQVAAAAPRLCMDATHGHPLGGGDWWVKGYGQMLTAIRRAMPPDTMLTTECNGEPFMRWFDGYLTWHWQHDGQVPAFPAVYGGAIQMFGRAYRGGETKDLALHMKAGQQFVFGEQLGWLDPGIMSEKENAEFFRALVRLRAKFNRYFSAGEMARPPQLLGDMPTVKADWQWEKDWWVTTDAVLTGAWALPKEKRLVLLFVNASDQPVTATLRFDGSRYGIRARRLRCAISTSANGGSEPRVFPAQFDQSITFAPRQAQAWAMSW